jgi:LVIVD repeat
MRGSKARRLGAVAAVGVGLLLAAAAPAAQAQVAPPFDQFTFTSNLTPLGYSERIVPIDNTVPGQGVFNSDLAFWGDTAVQGSYAGFRLIDVSDPANPELIKNWTECTSPTSTTGNQGDVIVWNNLVIRSWNSGTPAPQRNGQSIPVTDPARFTTPGAFCGDWPMFREPAEGDMPERGQEGVHIIDISNPADPDVIAFVDTPCGSHTETLVPDLENDRLLVYSNSSANTTFGDPTPGETPPHCSGFDIIEVPLDDPASAFYLRFEPAGGEHGAAERHACHDTGVILDDVNLVACTGSDSGDPGGGNGASLYTVDPAKGGSKEDPRFLDHVVTGGISLGHSAAFSWDGDVMVIGHEPGGGSGAECDATDNPLERTFFFVETNADPQIEVIGQFTMPRLQTNLENCTTHNYNIVPTPDGDVMVSGNYQSGISVVDFTNPAGATEIAFADPAPLVDPNPPVGIELGGDWSSYWYNGTIYESDITRGLLTWRLNHPLVANARTVSHSNPQTQYTSLGKDFQVDVLGQVPTTLSLSVDGPVAFGAFTPGVAMDYLASAAATVNTSTGDATLSVTDKSGNAPGKLVNGDGAALASALQARARNAANPSTAFATVSATPLTLLSYSGPVSNDQVSLEFQQSIGATEVLAAGGYSKTLTFTLSTTQP